MLLGAGMGALSSIAMGELSQHIGRKKTFVGIGLVAIVALPLLISGMGTATGSAVTWYALAISFLGSAGFAPLMIYLNERFPTDIRATGTALSWNVGFAIGGIMPTFVSLAAKTPSDIPHVLSIFLGALAAIYLLGAIISPETRGRLAA
jgi:MFS family permease